MNLATYYSPLPKRFAEIADVVNPDARDNPKSAIAGMPILEVDQSSSVIVLKRGKLPNLQARQSECIISDQTTSPAI